MSVADTRQPEQHPRRWSPKAIARTGRMLDKKTPQEILKWSVETFGEDLVLATGFGPSGAVLIDMITKVWDDPRVFYLETDLLFTETYDLRDQIEDRYGFRFDQVRNLTLEEQKEVYGDALWERNPDACCSLRKVLPLKRYLEEKKAWITGIRRDQSSTRANISVLEWDKVNHLVKLNPLAHWTEEEVWTYIQIYELPYNRLHDEGYPSVGCIPCTRPVEEGEDRRAGRWAGKSKTECGIHLPMVQELGILK